MYTWKIELKLDYKIWICSSTLLLSFIWLEERKKNKVKEKHNIERLYQSKFYT